MHIEFVWVGGYTKKIVWKNKLRNMEAISHVSDLPVCMPLIAYVWKVLHWPRVSYTSCNGMWVLYHWCLLGSPQRRRYRRRGALYWRFQYISKMRIIAKSNFLISQHCLKQNSDIPLSLSLSILKVSLICLVAESCATVPGLHIVPMESTPRLLRPCESCLHILNNKYAYILYKLCRFQKLSLPKSKKLSRFLAPVFPFFG